MNNTTQTETRVPFFKKTDAQIALGKAKMVASRLRAMRDAKTPQQFAELRSALVFDMNTLNLSIQTL